jgi:hypothetical protein
MKTKIEPVFYPPGWFTEPVYAWWPDFKPQSGPPLNYSIEQRKLAGKKGKETTALQDFQICSQSTREVKATKRSAATKKRSVEWLLKHKFV